MLKIKYSDTPGGKIIGKDITSYVTHVTWSGDNEQAARKLEFQIAYNVPNKDKTFQALDLKLGGFVYLYYSESGTSGEMVLFQGRIFFRKRTTNTFTFEFTAYDDLIYVAKSNIRAQMVGRVDGCIQQVCRQIGIKTGDIPSLSTRVDFIADDKSGTEVIKMLLDSEKAATGNEYTALCIGGAVNVVKKGELIDDYVASNLTNVFSTEHSESIEDMVNRVQMVDENGNIIQTLTSREDLNRFGMIQKIYKSQPPKGETVDNIKAAKALLKGQKDESSLKGLGYVQCITGYSIKVQEEQLQGTFYIRSDTHEFRNGVHTMSLTLEYLENSPMKIEQVAYAPAEFVSSDGRMEADDDEEA